MKLFVTDKDNRKVYINKVASSRSELLEVLGKNEFKVRGKKYYVRNVRASVDSNDTFKGILVGGVVGAFAGPIGIAVGGIAGAIIGNGSDLKKRKNVVKFNKSKNKWAMTNL